MIAESVGAGLPSVQHARARFRAVPARLRRALDLLALLSLAWLTLCMGCGPKVDNSRVKLPQPVESTTLGPGDLFTLEVVGEKDLPKDFQVASDGTVDFPYVHRMEVQGMEPQELARTVRDRLIELRILTDPSVIVLVKEYNSKRVTVLGEVKKPGSFALRPGMTLVQAISDAGGLSAIANGDRVNLTRKEKGSSTTVVLSFDSITSGKSPDIPLQAGDQIFVNERIF